MKDAMYQYADLDARYGVQRNARSFCARYFRLPVLVELVEMPDHDGDFVALSLMPPYPRLTVWQHLCSIPRRFWSGAFWFHSCEEEPLLVTVIPTGDDSTVLPVETVRAWLQAHCSWNF